MKREHLGLVAAVLLAACEEDELCSSCADLIAADTSPSDARVEDAMAAPDAELAPDRGGNDASEFRPDSGSNDVGSAPDTHPFDAGRGDAAEPDAASVDAGSFDAGPDAGVGQLIAFASRRGSGDYDIFTMKPDGTDVRQLTTDPAIDLFPSWSPNGTLGFVSLRTGSLALYLLEPSTSEVTELLTPGVFSPSSPAFSPDGSIVAFEGRPAASATHEIWVVPALGGTPVRLTNNTFVDAGPVWSPDGSLLYFVSDRSGQYEIWSMRLNGMEATQITTSSGILGKPTLSADGSRLAWSRLTADMERSRIVVEEIATHTRTTLTNEDDSEPAYDPTGRWLLFTTTRFGDPEVMSYDLGTSGPSVRLTNDLALDGASAMSNPF